MNQNLKTQKRNKEARKYIPLNIKKSVLFFLLFFFMDYYFLNIQVWQHSYSSTQTFSQVGNT